MSEVAMMSTPGEVYSGKVIQFPVVSRTPVVRKNLLARSQTKAAEPLISYKEIKAMSDWFILHGKYRDNALFITGLCTGFRISDLVRLRVKDVMDVGSHTFNKSIDIFELKTGKRTVSKLDEVIITEAIRRAVTNYMDVIGWKLRPDDYLFRSRKKNSDGEYRLDESQGYRIITNAAKECGLQEHVGSHTMRKTFLNIANTVGSMSKLRGSTTVMTDCQILARHSSLDVTLQYMNLTKSRLLSLREGVSAFVLGKTAVKDLEIRYEFELEDEDDE